MKWWIIALTMARLADAGSFCDATRRGFVEANPLMPKSCPAQLGVQAGLAAVQGYFAQKAKSEDRKVLKWVLGINVGLEGVIVYHNLRIGR
jgi:hypothetical protein